MTSDEYIESILYRLTQGNPSLPVGFVTTTIAGQKNTVLQRLAEHVATSPSPATQSLLHKAFTQLTLVSGEAAEPTDALTSALPNAQIIVSDGSTNIWPEPAEWVGSIFDLLNPPRIFDYIFFTVHNRKLKFRQYTTGGVVVPTMNSVTLNKADMISIYIPTLADIALTDDVADILFDTAVAMFNEGQQTTAAKAETN